MLMLYQADFSYETKDKTETSNSTQEANQGRKQLNSPAEIWKKLAFPFIVFFFNNVTLLFIYWCFVVLHVPSSENKCACARPINRKIGQQTHWSTFMADIHLILLLCSATSIHGLRA